MPRRVLSFAFHSIPVAFEALIIGLGLVFFSILAGEVVAQLFIEPLGAQNQGSRIDRLDERQNRHESKDGHAGTIKSIENLDRRIDDTNERLNETRVDVVTNREASSVNSHQLARLSGFGIALTTIIIFLQLYFGIRQIKRDQVAAAITAAASPPSPPSIPS